MTVAAWSTALFLSSTLFSHDVALRLILLALSFALVLGTAASKDARSRVQWLPPIWLPFLLWAVWAALTQTWALDPALSAKEWRNELFYTGIAFFTCYVAAQGRQTEKIFLPLLAVATVLLCATAVRDYWVTVLIPPEGWHGGQGNLSGILLVLFPCVLMTGWLATRHSQGRYIAIASGALAACMFAGAYATLSRTIWLALMLQALIAGAFVLRKSPPMRDGILRSRMLVGGTLVVVAAIAMASVTYYERLAAHLVYPLQDDPRFTVWSAAASLVAQRPLTGYGFGRGMLHEPLARAAGDPMLWHSHNLFIDAALQTGLSGALLLLALLGSTLLVGWRLARSPADRAAACGIALIAVVVGMAVRNSTDLVWQRHPALLYWGVVGVLMAWGTSESAHSTNSA